MPPHELEKSLGKPAGEVAGAVAAGSRPGAGSADGIGDEPLRGQLGAPEVAAGEPRATDPDLALDADRHLPHRGIEQVDVQVGHGEPERRPPLRRRRRAEVVEGGADRRLGRAVAVDDAEARRGGGDVAQEGLADRLDADEQAGERPPSVPSGLQPRGEVGEQEGRKVEAADAVALHPREQPLGAGAFVLAGDVQHAAMAEGGEDLPRRDVEADARPEAARLARGQGPAPVQVGDHVEEPPVGAGDALGPAGRAGGVDDVGRVVRAGTARDRSRRLSADLLPAGIQGEDGRAGPRQVVRRPSLGEQHRRARVVEHQREPLAGVAHVERHVGAAGLEDPQHADDHLDGAPGAEPHRNLGSGPEAVEHPGELVGAPVELAAGQDRAAADHGRRVGRRRRPCRAPVVQAGLQVEGHRAVVPGEERAAFGGGEQGELRQAERRLRGGTREEGREMAGHPLGRGGVEEVGAVFQEAADPTVALAQGDGEVEHRRPAPRLLLAQGEAGKREGGQGRVLQGEHHLEQGVAAQVPIRPHLLDQAFEGGLLVAERLQGGLAHPPEQRAERRISRQVRTQHHGVDEEADQPFELRALPPGDR